MVRCSSSITLHSPTELSGVVATAMRTLDGNKVVWDDAGFAAILAIDVAHGASIGRGHGLHSYCGIDLSEVLTHIFHTFLTERAGPLPRPLVHGEALHVHDVTTAESFERFDGLEHALVTDGAIALKLLRDAVVLLFKVFVHGYAGVASHAVAVVDPQPLAGTTDIAEGAVVNILTWTVII